VIKEVGLNWSDCEKPTPQQLRLPRSPVRSVSFVRELDFLHLRVRKRSGGTNLAKTFPTDRFANEGRNSSCDETSRVELVGMRETYAPVATVPLLTSVAGLFRLLARTLLP